MRSSIRYAISVNERITLDTNVINALWRKNESIPIMRWLEMAVTQGALSICAVVYAELLALPRATHELVESFLQDSRIAIDWEITPAMWLRTGEAYRDYAARRAESKESFPRRLIADFIIGAHAFHSNASLATLDERHYAVSFPDMPIIGREIIMSYGRTDD